MKIKFHLFNIKTKKFIVRLFIFLGFVVLAGFLGLHWGLVLILGMAIFLISMLGISIGKKRKWKEPELRKENYNVSET